MSTVAKASITLVSISDAYSVALTPSVCVIHADYDGSHPVLTNAYTLITVFCGEVKVPFTVEAVTTSHSSVNYSLSKIDDYTYRLAITDLHYSLLEGGLEITVKPNEYTTLNGRFLFSVERESTMLDWIQSWESNKTTIGATSIITPKLFVGKKITGSYNSLAEVPGLTGVYIGPSENDSCGVYGYRDSIEIFHLDETGGKIGGWNMSQDGLYSVNGKLQILSNGSIRAVDDNQKAVWEICEDGSASFALGNVKFYANGDAEFKGKITSSEGQIASWTIADSQLYCIPIALSATDKYIAVANITSYPLKTDGTWNGNHFSWVKLYGGAAMHFTSSQNYGLIAYNGSAKQVFSAGSTNFIAGWNFDEAALWIGTKNNNAQQYTGDANSLTIGTQGIRGATWYIDKNGTVSFVKGAVVFNETSGTIAGWTISTSSISKNNVSLGANGSISNTNGLWSLNNDGSGYLAGSNAIYWDSWGNLYINYAIITNGRIGMLSVLTENDNDSPGTVGGLMTMGRDYSSDPYYGKWVSPSSNYHTISASYDVYRTKYYPTGGWSVAKYIRSSRDWLPLSQVLYNGTAHFCGTNINFNNTGDGNIGGSGNKITWNANGYVTISNVAASDHNHDGVYAASSHTHTGYASSSHTHSSFNNLVINGAIVDGCSFNASGGGLGVLVSGSGLSGNGIWGQNNGNTGNLYLNSGAPSTALVKITNCSCSDASDERIKTIFYDVPNVLDKLEGISAFYYTYKEDEDKILKIGVSAQAVREVFPEAVTLITPDNSDSYYGVNYIQLLTAVGINGLKELHAKVKVLEDRVAILEKQLSVS